MFSYWIIIILYKSLGWWRSYISSIFQFNQVWFFLPCPLILLYFPLSCLLLPLSLLRLFVPNSSSQLRSTPSRKDAKSQSHLPSGTLAFTVLPWDDPSASSTSSLNGGDREPCHTLLHYQKWCTFPTSWSSFSPGVLACWALPISAISRVRGSTSLSDCCIKTISSKFP